MGCDEANELAKLIGQGSPFILLLDEAPSFLGESRAPTRIAE
jgi:hypothetical protein